MGGSGEAAAAEVGSDAVALFHIERTARAVIACIISETAAQQELVRSVDGREVTLHNIAYRNPVFRFSHLSCDS